MAHLCFLPPDTQQASQRAAHHSSAQAVEAIQRSHELGIESVSIDLIYGLAGQSMESWIDTMYAAIASVELVSYISPALNLKHF